MTPPDSWLTGPSPITRVSEPEPPRVRGGVGIVTLLVVSLAAAAIASLGTVALLQPGSGTSSGARPVAIPTPLLVQAGPTAVPEPSASPAAGAGAPSVIVTVADHVSPAVVTVTSDLGALNPFSIPETGVGSGFIFDTNGWILTNNHVVEGASNLTVQFKDGHELAARVVKTNPGWISP